MDTYVSIKKSQAMYYIETPLFIQSGENVFVLYKPEGKKLDSKRFVEDDFPKLVIESENGETAKKELKDQLKIKLKNEIRNGNLKIVRSALCEIVQEAMQDPLESKPQPVWFNPFADRFAWPGKRLRISKVPAILFWAACAIVYLDRADEHPAYLRHNDDFKWRGHRLGAEHAGAFVASDDFHALLRVDSTGDAQGRIGLHEFGA
ncbi:MAG: hypothetical protein MUD09_07990 [Desulfobacterales bacterium]|jgi:hypothetical protein|nr:hypothetical protein [Desulfobacterales bacterium]